MVKPRRLSVAGLKPLVAVLGVLLGVLGISTRAAATDANDPARVTEDHPAPMQPAMVNYPLIACAPSMIFIVCILGMVIVHNTCYRWDRKEVHKTRSQIASRLRRWAHEHPLPENAEKPWLHDIELAKSLHPGPLGLLYVHLGEFVGMPLLHSANVPTKLLVPLSFLGLLMCVQFGFSTVVEYKSSTLCLPDFDCYVTDPTALYMSKEDRLEEGYPYIENIDPLQGLLANCSYTEYALADVHLTCWRLHEVSVSRYLEGLGIVFATAKVLMKIILFVFDILRTPGKREATRLKGGPSTGQKGPDWMNSNVGDQKVAEHPIVGLDPYGWQAAVTKNSLKPYDSSKRCCKDEEGGGGVSAMILVVGFLSFVGALLMLLLTIWPSSPLNPLELSFPVQDALAPLFLFVLVFAQMVFAYYSGQLEPLDRRDKEFEWNFAEEAYVEQRRQKNRDAVQIAKEDEEEPTWALQDEFAEKHYPGTMSDIYSYARPNYKVVDGCYCKAADLSGGWRAGTMRRLRFPWTYSIPSEKALDDFKVTKKIVPFPETDTASLIKFISPIVVAKWFAFARDELKRVVGKVNGREGGLLGTDTNSKDVLATAEVQFESHNLLPMYYSPSNGFGFDSVGTTVGI